MLWPDTRHRSPNISFRNKQKYCQLGRLGFLRAADRLFQSRIVLVAVARGSSCDGFTLYGTRILKSQITDWFGSRRSKLTGFRVDGGHIFIFIVLFSFLFFGFSFGFVLFVFRRLSF